jgi:hypothetical protein
VAYFRNLFNSIWWPRPCLEGMEFPCLSTAENDKLILPFSLQEIEDVVKDCDGSKSPGPDGFNFNFIKSFWSL